MDVRSITAEWLKSNGYDGLYMNDECGCAIRDLMPCDEPHPDCEAGHYTVRSITAEWLKSNGYDGLFMNGECSCEICDLMPCDEPHPDCEAGHYTVCNPESCINGGGCEWHIGPKKETETQTSATSGLKPED